MSASSVLGIIGASLALADAVLSPMTNTTTKTTQQQSNARSSYSQEANRSSNNNNTQVYQSNSGNRQTQTQSAPQNFNPNNYYSSSRFKPPTSNQPTPVKTETTQVNTPTKTVNSVKPEAIAPVTTEPPTPTETATTTAQVKTPKTPPTPPKVELSEEEKFLLDFLPSLYSGDKDAIKKNTDGCESDEGLSELIIEDLMQFSENAEAHKGFSSAKVRSRKTRGDRVALITTVTFKDESTSDETFNVIKRPEEPWKYYVE